MEPDLTATTLAGRNEVRGRRYPIRLERLALLLSFGLCITIGIHVVRADYLPTWGDVLLFIIVLPVTVLIIAESLGRMIQNMIG